MKINYIKKKMFLFVMLSIYLSANATAIGPIEISNLLVESLPKSHLFTRGKTAWMANGRETSRGYDMIDTIAFRNIDTNTRGQTTLTMFRKILSNSPNDIDRINLYLRPMPVTRGAMPKEGYPFQLLVDSSRVNNPQAKYIQAYIILDKAAKNAGLTYRYMSSEAGFVADGLIHLKSADDFQALLKEIDTICDKIALEGPEASGIVLPEYVYNVDEYLQAIREAANEVSRISGPFR